MYTKDEAIDVFSKKLCEIEDSDLFRAVLSAMYMLNGGVAVLHPDRGEVFVRQLMDRVEDKK
ncbi:hypothetical protein [Vibrio sp. CyArs1]|uniref:hypothetical protein n=1 Tax=Vibrio sp. CyArs1 TaxID=2682577 RepID=UPI001F05B7B5|nr:hypothetical protein [Vibrio sp. CyArs1]